MYREQLTRQLKKGLKMEKKKLETKIKNLKKKRFEKKGRCWVLTLNNYLAEGIWNMFTTIITGKIKSKVL